MLIGTFLLATVLADPIDLQLTHKLGEKLEYVLETKTSVPAKIDDATKVTITVDSSDEKTFVLKSPAVTRSSPLGTLPAATVKMTRYGKMLTQGRQPEIQGYYTSMRLPEKPVAVAEQFQVPIDVDGKPATLTGKIVRMEGEGNKIAVIEMSGPVSSSGGIQIVARISSKFDTAKGAFLESRFVLGDAEGKYFSQALGLKLVPEPTTL
jgi:hypothetical protein